MPQGQKIEISRDGSSTVYSSVFDAHYHSIYGALDESVHVFLVAGLYHLVRRNYKHINVFEMGLGTGLNALLTLLDARKYNIRIQYDAIESHPLHPSVAEKLNYCQLLDCDPDLLNNIHQAAWDQASLINPEFTLHKIKNDIHNFELAEDSFDLVYWDAFAPSCQSSLWEAELHARVYKSVRPGGVLVSYCSRGHFRRMLSDLGYRVDRLNGPAQKREMIRAVKE